MSDRWYSLDDLPFGRCRVRVRWPGFRVLAVRDGVGKWFEIRGRELVPIDVRQIEAWQPENASVWTWPDRIEPSPLPVQVSPSLGVIGGVAFNATEAAAEMEEWREAARARRGDEPPPDTKSQWWRDVTRIAYQPMGSIEREHGEARIMRHLILERGMALDIRRQRSNAAVLADLKRSWADIYGEQSEGDDWVPPLVPQPQDWADFEVVMGWFAEVAPSNREMFVLRGRMLAPPTTWRRIGDDIHRHWTRAQQIYKEAITDLVDAGNRPRRRAEARIAALRTRNWVARGRANNV